MSVVVWYPHLLHKDVDGRLVVGRMVEQAAEVVATRQAMIDGVLFPVSGLRAVEWHPRLIYAAGLRLAHDSLQAVDRLIDVLLASFHGVFRRAASAPWRAGHDDWPDSLQDVLLVHLLVARTPLVVPAHDAKEKARLTPLMRALPNALSSSRS